MYYSIHSFMTQELHLTGIDLNVFALIYSFSEYKGSLNSICSLVGAKSVTTIQYSLKRLLNMGIIIKDKPNNKFSTCTYKVAENIKYDYKNYDQFLLRKQSALKGEWKSEKGSKTEIGISF